MRRWETGIARGPILVVALAAAALLAGSTGAAVAWAAEAADGVEWGGETHADRESLERWLRARGASFELWAERHPAAAARLEQAAGEEEPADEEEEQEDEGGGLALIAIAAQEATGLTTFELGTLVGVTVSMLMLLLGALLVSPVALSLLPPSIARSADGAGLLVAAAGITLLVAVLLAFLVLG